MSSSSSIVEKEQDDGPVDLADVVEKRLQVLTNDGANAIVDWEYQDPELPPYYDKEKFKLGQRMFYNNVFSMMIAKLVGLVSLLVIPTILDVIVFTKQSSTPCLAFRRYVATIFHTFVWYKKVPEKQDEFFESLKIVRKKHCVAFRRSVQVGGCRKPSQLDMALAQFGFVGFSLICEKQLALSATKEEVEGLVHFWRVVGSMLGMEEKYNLCSGSVEESRALCRRVLDEMFLPFLANRNEKFNEMAEILLKGLWCVCPHIDTEAFMGFSLKLASSAATNNNHSIDVDTSKMSFYSRCLINLQFFVLRYLMAIRYKWAFLFRAFFNSQMRLAIYLTGRFPFLAYWSFGMKKSHVNIFK